MAELEQRLEEQRAARNIAAEALDELREGCAVFDRQLRYLYVNPALARQARYSAAQLLGRPLVELFPGIEATAIYEALSSCLREGTPREMVEEYVFPDGSAGWFDLHFSPSPVGVTMLSVEVTARHRAETALERANAELERLLRERSLAVATTDSRLQLVLDTTSQGIYGIDLNGRCSFVNRAALTALGYASADEVLGKNNHQLFHHSHADGQPYDVAACPIYAVLHDLPQADVAHEVFWRKDGSSFPVEFQVRPKIRDGQRVGCVVSFADISERRRVELELLEAKRGAESANRAKGTFLANMSHEIRTPMNAVLGFTQLMLRAPDTTPTQRKQLGTIARAGDHLLRLIDQILQFARIESHTLELDEATFDLRALFVDLEQLFRARAAARGLQLLCEVRPGAPSFLVADEGKLRQVLSNLLSNALRFTERGGVAVRVDVRANGRGPALVVEVEDSGEGISQDELAFLFRKFEQTESGKRSRTGTGLGLAISREFARLMGGDITVRSTLGQGSVFRLELPLVEGKAEDVVAKVTPRRVKGLSTGQAPFRVLVVDDREDNRNYLLALLGGLGFEVRQAADGAAGVASFEAWQPHLVLMDMRMPVMGGTEAIGRIRALPGGEAVRIISITASAFEEDRAAARLAGADDFISKPFREEVLVDKLEALLGARFDREDADAAPAAPAEAFGDAFPAARIAGLPLELRARVRQAALAADQDLLVALADQVHASDAGVAAHMRRLAESFSYQRVLELFPEGEPKP